jgi:hypothetical protein
MVMVFGAGHWKPTTDEAEEPADDEGPSQSFVRELQVVPVGQLTPLIVQSRTHLPEFALSGFVSHDSPVAQTLPCPVQGDTHSPVKVLHASPD